MAAAATSARAEEALQHPPLDRAALAARLASGSPALRAARARVDVAAAEVAVAGVRPNPSVGWEREAVPERDAHDDFVRLNVPLDLSGRRGRRLGAARAALDADRADAERAAAEVAHDAYAAYARAAHARQRLAVLDATRTQLVELVDTLAARARGGDAADLDATRAGLELDLIDDLRASARRDRDDAERALAGVLGERGGYTAVDDLRAGGSASGGGAASGDGGNAATRADIAAARHRAEAARREAQAAGRGWVPELELSVGLLLSADGGASTGAGDGGTALGYVVGIGGALPFFDRGAAAQRRSRALATAWTAEAEALSARASADSERLRARVGALGDQIAAFEAGPRARASALVRRTTSAYRDGARDLLDVIDAHRAARDVELRALELLLDRELASIELARSGGSLP
jgi:cobalt-zinc-cadmium efflux system outer membrane protein